MLETTPFKRGRPKKTAACLNDRYPALSTLTNDVHAEEEKSCWDALQVEMTSSRPRRDIFLPLMKKTFIMRRHFIIHNASSVHDILRDYPALKEPSAVSKMFSLSYFAIGSLPPHVD